MATVLDHRRAEAVGAPDSQGPAVPRRTRIPAGPVLLVVLLAVSGLVHSWNAYQSPGTTVTDDEGTYVSQAWALVNLGELANYTYWYDHPPVGWMMLAGYAWLTDGFDRLPAAIMVGREFMLVMKLVTVALLYGLARRLGISRTFTAIGILLVAVNPLALFFQRLTLLDNIAVPWVLAAFFLAASPRRRLGEQAASAVCFAVAVLTKETLLLLLPALVYVMWQHSARRTRPYVVVVVTTLFATTVLVYPLFALLKGELLPGEGHVSLWDAVRWQLVERQSSGSVFDPQSPAAGFVSLWRGLDLFFLALALAAIPVALLQRKLRPVALVLVIQGLALLRGGYLPLAHPVAALPFAALVVAGVLDGIWRSRFPVSSWLGRWASRVPSLPRMAPALSVAVILGLLLTFAAGVVWPRWLPQVQALATEQDNTSTEEATAWAAEKLPRDAIVLVGHGVWVDLVQQGFSTENIIWYYKPDTDPEVSQRLPNNWRDIGYLISNVEMRATVDSVTGTTDSATIETTIEAFENSEVIASFGEGGEEIIVHRVDPTRE